MTIDRLRAHYGFSRMPFGRDLAPQMLFASRAHREAVARISWLVSEAAMGTVTGEVGAGKTVAARAAATGLDTSRHTVIYLSNPAVGARGPACPHRVVLGRRPALSSSRPQAKELLAAEEQERGKRVVVIIDESHLLDSDQLEQVRLLTNFDMDSHSPCACLLLGQPALRRRIKLGSFAALDQRIALRYNIDGMDLKETASYVKHHLGIAGRTDTLFSDDAVALIHQSSRGIPRAINNLAMQALVAAFADNKGIVDESSARAAVEEVISD